MTISNLEVRVRLLEAKTAQAEAKKTQRAIAGIGSSSKTSGKQAAESAAGFDTMAGGAKRLRSALAFVAGAAGLGSVLYGIRDAIRAGQQWQAQQAQLQNALRNTGRYSAAAMDQLDAAIARTSTHGGFSPQEEAQGLANFVRLTGSSTRAIQLNREALDLARGANMGYSQALRSVSQIQTGQVGRLQKYIGIVQPVTTHVNSLTAAQKRLYPELYKHMQLLDKLATAQEANRLILERYRNATNVYGHTAAGAISNATHAFDLLAEQIGRVLLPIVTKAAIWLTGVAQTVTRYWPQIKAAINTYLIGPVRAVIGWLGGLKTIAIGVGAAFVAFETVKAVMFGLKVATTAWAVAQAAAAVATWAWTAATAALDAAFVGLDVSTGGLFLAIGAGIAALAIGFVELVKHFGTVVSAVKTAFTAVVTSVGTAINWIGSHWAPVLHVLEWPFTRLPRLIVGAFNTVKRLVMDVVNWIVSKFDWVAKKVKDAVNTIKGIPGKVWGVVSSPFRAVGHLLGLHQGGFVRGFAPGGYVPGVGNSDSVPAYLTPGEFVLRREVVQQIGVAPLNALNALGGIRGGAGGELLPVTVQSILGGRVIAESTTHVALKRAALS